MKLFCLWFYILGAVRVGEVDGKFVINPTWSELSISKLNVVVACSKTKVGKMRI